MAWLRLESTFARHRKTRRLAEILRIPIYSARGLVAGLFCVICAESPDGDLDDWDAADIAYACDWDGDKNALLDALLAVRFIVSEAGHMKIRNWMKYAEGYKAAERARKYRERKASDVTHHARERDANVTHHARERIASRTRHKDGRTDRPTDEPKQCMKSDPQNDQMLPISTGADAPALSANGNGQEKTIDDPKIARDDIQEIWQHYRAHHPGTAKVLRSNRKEYELIRARLQDFDADTIRAAIDGYHRSPFHMGDNDRGKSYLSLTLILRDISHVQAGLEMTAKRLDVGPKTRILDPAAFAGDMNARKGEQWKTKTPTN